MQAGQAAVNFSDLELFANRSMSHMLEGDRSNGHMLEGGASGTGWIASRTALNHMFRLMPAVRVPTEKRTRDTKSIYLTPYKT